MKMKYGFSSMAGRVMATILCPLCQQQQRLKLSPQYSVVSQVPSTMDDFIVEDLMFYPSVEISSGYIYPFSGLNYNMWTYRLLHTHVVITFVLLGQNT